MANVAVCTRDQSQNEIINVLQKLKNRPYDDIIIAWCDGYSPKSFSNVEIEYAQRKEGKVGVRLGNLYNSGVKIIENKESEDYTSLLNFLKDSNKDAESISKVFFSTPSPSEAEVTAVLAVHLFGKITHNSRVLLDKTMAGLAELSGRCPCKCNGTFQTDSIGIGSSEVWHGYPDIEVGTVMVSVVTKETEDDVLSDEDDAPSPVKQKKTEIEHKKDSIKTEAIIRQVVAQTITNSFAQVAVNKGLRKKLIPTILCSPRGVQMFVYNVEHDFLLSTLAPLAILETDQYGAKKLCIATVLEIWLALHVHLTGCDADSFAGDSGLSQCRFQELMEERSALKFYHNAENHAKAFSEKVATKFKDLLLNPFGTIYLDPHI